MNNSLLGNQISKFRKERNMTQEELGRAVGVSTQAVSRWECGGAPDVTLLPAIADTLHVAIDALFGREGGEYVDMTERVARWAASVPREELLNAMVDLIWAVVPGMLLQEFGVSDIAPLERAEIAYNGETCLSKTQSTFDFGLLMGSYARDLKYMLVFPEPEDGYASFFADSEQYRALFEVLSRPHALEILYAFAGEKEHFMVAASVAKRVGIAAAELAELLNALAEQKLVNCVELELESGVTTAYSLCTERVPALIVFLYFARYISQPGEVNHVCGSVREKPWLGKTAEQGEQDARSCGKGEKTEKKSRTQQCEKEKEYERE